MAKQKVLIKVSMNCQKARSKAMKIAVGVSGVEAAAIQGESKDQIEVTGEGVDSVVLTCLLRKRFGHAELVSVGDVKKEEKKEEPIVWSYSYNSVPHYYPYPVCAYQYENNPSCSIM